jgi:hypothetical protein
MDSWGSIPLLGFGQLWICLFAWMVVCGGIMPLLDSGQLWIACLHEGGYVGYKPPLWWEISWGSIVTLL